MTAPHFGILLVWLGTVMMAGLVWRRMRRGAWGADAFDQPPPTEPWAVPALIGGLVLAGVGMGLMVGGLG